MKIGDMQKITESASGENDDLNIRYYCKTEELFDVLETAHLNTGHKRTRGKTLFLFLISKNILPIGVHTFTVKVSDYTMWRHTWRINWVNCAVLAGNSAGIRTVFPVIFYSSLWESHSFLSLPADTTMASSRKARNL